MKLRLPLVAAVVAAAVAAALLLSNVQAPPSPPAAAPARPALASTPLPGNQALPARNVFAYLDAAPSPVESEPRFHPTDTDGTPPPAIVESPVRLVGLVRKRGRLEAAVSINGQVVVLGEGESAEGYTVLRIDEENGARVRDPSGAEVSLIPPGR